MMIRRFPPARVIVLMAAILLPGVVRAQVGAAVLNFTQQMGTHNVIVTDELRLDNSHTQSGIAAGGSAWLNNAVVNQNASYTSDAYAVRVYGQLSLNGNNQSLNGGATVVRNAGTNTGLNDFARNGGNQRVLTFGPNQDANPQLAFNGNSGAPVPTAFVAATDAFFTSRAASLGGSSGLLAAAVAIAPTRTGSTLNFATSGSGSITVFDLDVGALGAGINQFSLSVAAGTTAVINVLNAGSAWNPGSVNFLGSDLMSQAGRILWNLEGGLNLVTTNEWYGSILGVGSSVTANGNLNGQIFAEDLNMNSRELHFVPFQPSGGGGAPIPEPSTYGLLAGLGIFGWLVWRRQRLAGAAVEEPPVAGSS